MEHATPILLSAKRVHDVCGPSAAVFAAIRVRGVWIEVSGGGFVHPLGLRPFADPAGIVFVRVVRQRDALCCMEEALRAVGGGTVVARLSEPVGLTESRRLQLAAAEGGSTGLCLVPEGVASNAAETRWHSAPILRDGYRMAHRWKLLKNKKGILGSWEVAWNAQTGRVDLVSPSGGGARGAADAPRPLAAPLRSGEDARQRLSALLDQRRGPAEGVVG